MAGYRNVISGNSVNGELITGSGATGNVVEGDYIGVNAAGTAALGNVNGVEVDSGASGNTIGGQNVVAVQSFAITGSSGIVLLTFQSSVTSVLPLAPTASQVQNALDSLPSIGGAGGSASVTLVGSTYTVVFGGTLANSVLPSLQLTVNGVGEAVTIVSQGSLPRNIISGNTGDGVAITSATGNVLEGNYLGTNAAGTGAIANASGVVLAANGNLIGTNGDGVNDAAERNVISGNTQYGVEMNGAANNTIAGNYIGTNAAGMALLANGFSNVATFFSTGNIIGTDGLHGAFNVDERNVIGGGVILQNANVLAGNYIGLNAAGTAALSLEPCETASRFLEPWAAASVPMATALATPRKAMLSVGLTVPRSSWASPAPSSPATTSAPMPPAPSPSPTR